MAEKGKRKQGESSGDPDIATEDMESSDLRAFEDVDDDGDDDDDDDDDDEGENYHPLDDPRNGPPRCGCA